MDIMDGQPYCGADHFIGEGFVARPWPERELRWHMDISGYTGTPKAVDVVACYGDVWRELSLCVDIKPVQVTTAAKAHIRARFGRIDGLSKVLAWSHLSDGTMSPKEQQYDLERWIIANDAPVDLLDIHRVFEHENGHMLGLEHDNKDPNALLAPTYNRKVRHMTPRDVQRLLDLGYNYPPIVPPTPTGGETPSLPPPSSGKPVVISGWDKNNVKVNIVTLYNMSRVDIDPGDLSVQPQPAGVTAEITLGADNENGSILDG